MTDHTTTRYEHPCKCPECGSHLDSAVSVEGDFKPRKGDITVCGSCVKRLIFDDPPEVHIMTLGEWEGLTPSEKAEIQVAILAIRNSLALSYHRTLGKPKNGARYEHSKCPKCEAALSFISSVTGRFHPSNGDITVCGKCMVRVVFDAPPEVHAMTLDEWVMLPRDTKIGVEVAILGILNRSGSKAAYGCLCPNCEHLTPREFRPMKGDTAICEHCFKTLVFDVHGGPKSHVMSVGEWNNLPQKVKATIVCDTQLLKHKRGDRVLP